MIYDTYALKAIITPTILTLCDTNVDAYLLGGLD